ncbi:MAG: Ig-like domain-containing protein [Clostridia bacterium]|nr:Ig-like domain-containing protein [Clostridia bacterium]
MSEKDGTRFIGTMGETSRAGTAGIRGQTGISEAGRKAGSGTGALRRSLLLGLICGLILCLTGTALAEATVTPVISASALKPGTFEEDLDGLFSWFFIPEGIPEEITVRDASLTISGLTGVEEQTEAEGALPDATERADEADEAEAATPESAEETDQAEASAAAAENAGAAEEPGKDGESAEKEEEKAEPIVRARVEFLDGEEALREAVTVDPDGTVRIHNESLTAAGTAKFNLTFESEHYTASREETLVVTEYPENPVLTELYVDPVFYMQPGQSFTPRAALQAIARMDLMESSLKLRLNPPAGKAEVEPKETAGMSYDGEADRFTVDEFGVYDYTLAYSFGNLAWKMPFKVQATAYSITGPTWLMPGGEGEFRVTDVDAAAGRKYTWSMVEGKAEIDAKTGKITVGQDAEAGVPLKIALTPDEGPAIDTQIRIVDGALSVIADTTTEEEAGFSVPVPAGDEWDIHISEKRENGWIYRVYGTGLDGSTLIIEARTDLITSGFREDDQAVSAYYDETTFNDKARELQKETLRIDGHYARMYTYTTDGQNQQPYRMGEIEYARNNRVLTVTAYATRSGAAEESIIPITMADLRKIAEQIHYDKEKAPIRQADARLTLTAQDDADAVSAGHSIQMIPVYAGENVGKHAEERIFTWTVTDAETGEETEAAEITAGGKLTAAAGLEKPVAVKVTAVSQAYSTKASKTMTLMPTVQKIGIDSGDLTLYLGAEPVTVRALITPDTVPAKGLFWRTTRPDLFEVTEAEDGAVMVRPLTVGRAYLSVREPGGKAAQIALIGLKAVEGLELRHSGAAKPGATVRFTAVLQPQDAGNRNVTWTLNVGEDVATIGNNGKLRIGKNAPKGTEITVTCTSKGAPVPITVSEKITVE